MKHIPYRVSAALGMALATLGGGGALLAQPLTKVDIAPPFQFVEPGSYTTGVGDAFTIMGWGTPFYSNMRFSVDNPDGDQNSTGDVMTFAHEEINGDFDKRVRITSIQNAAFPTDAWARGGLMVRTGTNHFKASLHIVAGNPTAGGGANSVQFAGRPLDGQDYTIFGRSYSGVAANLPNQWLRLRRVGDYFSAYVGTNGTSWTLIGERYQEWPEKVYVGAYASAGTEGTQAAVGFATYGTVPVNDITPPRLVSAGTIDKKLVGVKFSEPVKFSTAKNKANYRLSQGTINNILSGISGDAVYLEVSGLTDDNFSVTITGGIQDTAGNLIAANSVAQARALNWNSIDLGRIQNPNNRPTPGDDPYRVGRAVAISSDENPEVEVVAGGSNAWDPGDYIHYLYRTTPLSGNFDVTIAVSRYDRSARQGGYSNSGLMLRARPYRAGMEFTTDGTKVPMVANTTYLENSAPNRGAIPLWRLAEGGGYGNGNAGFSWSTIIGGIKGYYSGLRGLDASGRIDPQSSPNSARYLRIKREGTVYFFYASWDGVDWAQVDRRDLPALPNELLLGFSSMTDSGAFPPPFSAYGNNGHMMDPNDPLNPQNPAIDPPAPGGRSYMNESNYAAQRIKVFPNGVKTPLPVAFETANIRAADSLALDGTFTGTGTYSFNLSGGGTGYARNLPAPEDGSTGGDEMNFAYEEVTGDFDQQVRITAITSQFFNMFDGSPYVPFEGEPTPVDNWARGGLMVRASTNTYSALLKMTAGNPAGANAVQVLGRGLDAQRYTLFSRSYPGVTNAIPNLWMRIQRTGNAFSFYLSSDGVNWSLVAQRYQEMPATLLLGTYAAGAMDPNDFTNNPLQLLSRTTVRYADYKKVDLGDLVPPALLSAGTLDKKTVGVKFSEQVDSATAAVASNYTLSQGTVSSVKIGIGGDTAYLTVNGLTSDTFTVTVNGVKDHAGNAIAANSSVGAKAIGYVSQDLGSIQNPNARPTPGDDPYRVGQAVAISSDANPEVEIIGGGSNAWDPGDYVHYLYRSTPLVGDFDVSVAVSRYDRSANQGGYSNSGLMLRASPYLAGLEYTTAGTKVPMVANTTYLENSGPGRGAIPLWRETEGGGYGYGNAGFSWTTLIGGIKGYYTGLRSVDATGAVDVESAPASARFLRIKRVGNEFTFFASWDGSTWETVDTRTLDLPNTLLYGFSTMTDSGASAPPASAYGANGHTIDPQDPLNPYNPLIDPPVPGGRSFMNESNYAAQRIRLFPNGVVLGPPGPLTISNTGGSVTISWPGTGTLQAAPTVNGPWTPVANQTNPYPVTPSGGHTFYRLAR